MVNWYSARLLDQSFLGQENTLAISSAYIQKSLHYYASHLLTFFLNGKEADEPARRGLTKHKLSRNVLSS